MRLVVVGATGNVGTAVLRRVSGEPKIDAVTGVARRVPPAGPGLAGAGQPAVHWRAIDVGGPDAVGELAECFAGAGAVVHLAWQIQPSHDRERLYRTNVRGSAQVAEAAVAAGVPALVVASSVGAYAPGPKDRRVAEDWPVTGVPGATYSEHKSAVEAQLAALADQQPRLRLVWFRPGLTFQRAAASQIARFFAGPLAPLRLLRAGRLPVVPSHPRLRAQAVHADDVADAFLRAVLSDVRGPFNLAAEPVLDADSLTGRFGGLAVPVPPGLLQAGATATWLARLQPTEPGWVRLGTRSPLMSSQRSESELGWQPRHSALDALAELFEGMADGAGGGTTALRPRPAAAARLAAPLAGRLPGHGDPY